MSDRVDCPNCGTSLRKGSTFCLKCGTRIADGMVVPPISPPEIDEREILAESALPDLDEWDVPEEEELVAEPDLPEDAIEGESIDFESELEDLEWEVEPTETQPEIPEEQETSEEITEEEMAWEVSEFATSDVKEGMPFKEVEPPKVNDIAPPEVLGIAAEEIVPETIEAVEHLFPKGRGETSDDFIDKVVGKPKRIATKISPSVVETPTCPECGAAMSTDSFEYPDYVYEAMGRARMEKGISLLKENEHEKAIEQFEIAKKLYEHAHNEKLVEEATKRVDQGYDAMAEHHYLQAEDHLKQGEFEWAIVQFKKARELYMFSTDAKKRAKCSQRVRNAYEEWGKALESEGDRLAKAGDTRGALSKYTTAAEKYREADAPKKLRGLEKKIRNA